MYKKLFYITSLILMLGASVACAGHPNPLCWWKFDGDVLDSSGNGYHGTLMGDPAPVFGAGIFDQALDTTEANGPGYVAIEGFKGILGGSPFSICAWINTSDDTGTLVGWGSTAGGVTRFEFRPDADELRAESSGNVQGLTQLPDNEWIHVAVTVKAGAVINDPDVLLYLNGQVDNDPSTGSNNALQMAAGDDVAIARRHTSGRWFDALIDDLRIYDLELSQKQVQEAMQGRGPHSGIATDPIPENGSDDILRNSILVWEAGDFAQTHDVYFGTVFEDVNQASRADPGSVLVSRDQADTSFDPGGLEFGQTYFWRVDDVSGAPGRPVFKGEVWRFEVESFSLPITPITVTTSSTHSEEMGPENIINGSGLNALDQHGTEGTTMWLSGEGDATPSIQFEFDSVYTLHEMWVWNSNQAIERSVGLGAKDVTIEVSTDGDTWTLIKDVPPFAQAPGSAAYAHNSIIDFGGVAASFVKLTITAGFGMMPQFGLSEVRFFYLPVHPHTPQPADGSVTDTADVVLNWRAGRQAGVHKVFFGTDPNALVLTATTQESSYPITDLEHGTAYYWQIVEVNAMEHPPAYVGPIWGFSIPAYRTVDNFDQYDDRCNRIFFAWQDGLGHNGGVELDDCDVAPFNGNGGGSIVGHAGAPFAEQGIVYAGNQSLPLEYDNAFGLSETTVLLDGQDWTTHELKSLSLFLRGEPGNTGQLYAKINTTKIPYEGLSDALQRTQWLPWTIDLSTVVGNLKSVNSLTIGVEGANASGMLYVDEIRLYPLERELIAPADPGTANLVAYYPLDGDYQDASGNERHGTPVGEPNFVPGAMGQALELDGVDDYVSIDSYQGIPAERTDPNNPVQRPFTVACWINTTSDGSLIFWGSQDGTPIGGQYQNFRVNGGRLRSEHGNGRFRGASTVNDGEWHHVALAVEAGANMHPPGTRIYVDGIQDPEGADTVNAQNLWNISADVDMAIGVRASHGDRFFAGSIDEARVYDRALTTGEIRWLAGFTEASDKAL